MTKLGRELWRGSELRMLQFGFMNSEVKECLILLIFAVIYNFSPAKAKYLTLRDFKKALGFDKLSHPHKHNYTIM